MSTKANIYWLHRPSHTDIFTEGYIGVSSRPKKRLWEHKNASQNPHLQNAFNVYDDIIQTILLEGPEDYCYEIENKLRPTDKLGWNLIPGGNKPPSFIGKSHSDATRTNLSNLKKGKPLDPKTLEAAWAANRGHKHSDETRQKMSQPRQKAYPPVSEETRAKMRQAKIGFIPWNKGLKMGDQHVN